MSAPPIQIEGFDLTQDGINEIIFWGSHTNATVPYAGSEIAVYHKVFDVYEMLQLPRQNMWDNNLFSVGYSFYKTILKDNIVTIFNPNTGYQFNSVIEDELALNFFQRIDDNFDISSRAWRFETTLCKNRSALIIYNHVGGRDFDKDVATYLQWDKSSSSFIPVFMELVNLYEN